MRWMCAAAVSLLLLSACADDVSPGPGTVGGPAGYQQHRDLWAERGIATYSFSLYLGSFDGATGPFCGEAQVHIGVENGVVSAVREPFGCEVDPDDPSLAWVPFTIDEVFDLIVENGIEFEYDDTLGYPRAFLSEGMLRYAGDVVFPVAGSGFEIFVNDLEPGSADVSRADEVSAALAEHRARWEARGIASYRMSVERLCFCPPGSYQISVREGRVIDVTSGDGSVVGLGSDELDVFPLTVPDLFDEVARWASADGIQVDYDERLGYPVKVSVDPIENAIDDEVSYVVSGFQVR